ncbi:MAG TPA: helix-turn-helix transcriptional regulator [Jatrophihabitans sp.]|nr:helix-turn-helix transcriptional regulator [Jatrophihabitans sp.]
MGRLPVERHLQKARDFVDALHAQPLTVADMARVAGLSPAHFSRQFRRAYGESPHAYLLTRRLERAAGLLRNTDYPIADICYRVGWESLGSFTTSFGRMFGQSPAQYRAAAPPAPALSMIPACVHRWHGRPQNRTFREEPRLAGE